jgi:hypothetical protein
MKPGVDRASGPLVKTQERWIAARRQALFPPPTEDTMDDHLLRWLLHYPLQRIEDLMVGLNLSAAALRRRLADLEDKDLVEHVTYAYSHQLKASKWYYLTTLGLVAVSAKEGVRPDLAARSWQADEQGLLHLLARLPTWLRTQDLLNRLIWGAPQALADSTGHLATIRWRWMRQYLVSFQENGKAGTCEADVALVLGRARQGSSIDQFATIFLLLDLGEYASWSRPLITQRLVSFLRYQATRQPPHPLLMVLVESELGLERWYQGALEASYQQKGRTLQGVIVNLSQELALEPWHFRGARLGTRIPCRLVDQLTFGPRTALPRGIFPRLIAVPSASTPSSAPKVPLVWGKFQERQYQRETRPATPAPQRDALLLLGRDMNQRLLQVMDLLYTFPYLTIEDLAHQLGGLLPQSVKRYLWQLKQWDCLEESKQTNVLTWKLSKQGLHYFAAAHRVPLTEVLVSTLTPEGSQSWQPGTYTLARQPRHTAGLYRLLLYLPPTIERNTTTYQLLWVETQLHNSRRYRYQERWHLFRPDAAVTYGFIGKQEVRQRSLLWIEWDNGTMSEARLVQKMQAYAFYLHSHEWRKYGQDAGTPYLLCFVPDAGQLLRMAHAASVLDGCGITVLLTTHTLLHDQGFAGPIWRQVIPAAAEEGMRTLW